ncbi:MAG: sensor histidine kinase [Caulobacteraceae bacterium]|nr:sensor histidine kinase [Caulobacteraceae bacterium]
MSLRFRVVLAIVLVLCAGCAIGVALAGWQAHAALREELAAAVTSGEQSVKSAVAEMAPSDDPQRNLSRLVRSFDGDRHLRVEEMAPDGRVILASRPLESVLAPSWFKRVFGPKPKSVDAPVPMTGIRLRLTPLSGPDVGATWTEFTELSLVLGISILATAALAWLTVGQALHPLDDVSAALARIGSGRYDTRVADLGALELRTLTRGVNEMAVRLSAMQARTHALEHQLLTLQDEERADLARDLHDEMAPHLFAASVDAAMARRLIEEGRAAEALEQVASIGGAVAVIQRLVRDILGRLRPTDLLELGLSAAVGELVGFWSARHPDVRFDVATPEDDSVITGPLRETLYRVVQEGLSNAIRHGRPNRVSIHIETGRNWVEARVEDDGAEAEPPGPEGFGLSGMRERLAAVGGQLAVVSGGPGGGWSLIARAPLALQAEHMVLAS